MPPALERHNWRATPLAAQTAAQLAARESRGGYVQLKLSTGLVTSVLADARARVTAHLRRLDEQARQLEVEQARREVLECMLRLGELNFKGEVTRAEVAGVLRGAEDLASRMLARAPP